VSLSDRLRSTLLRIDARSLGLFRIAMGAVLLGDLFQRWTDRRAFYSNDGVLPNHAHLYHVLKQATPRVWSALHAFSTPGENSFAMVLILIAYVIFLIGYKTRVFHLISLALLVSLAARNVYLETPGTYVAITLLVATALLPCGSRFSIDSLLASLRARDEKDAEALNDRAPTPEAILSAERGPGWSPTSLAALAVLLHLTIVLVATWSQQSGPTWQDGSALHYALWVERWVSDLGTHVRSAPPALLAIWTRVLHGIPLLAPLCLFVPLPRIARPLAFAALLFYGLTYGLLFSFGLWGWTFVAAAFLAISTESWEAWQSRFAKGRALTVIYDADCGICLWLTRLLKRLDLRSHLTFQGNDALTIPPGQRPPYRSPPDGEAPRLLYRRTAATSPVETAPLPAEITDDLVTGTVVAVDGKGRVFTEGRAVAAIVRSLPLGFLLSLPLRIPGTTGLWDALYRKIPPRRFAISEALGLGACGVPPRAADALHEEPKPGEVSPSTRLRRLFTGGLREVFAVLLLLAAAAQTGKQNPWPTAVSVPQPRAFAAISGWLRMGDRYDVLAKTPAEDGFLVIDALTRAGRSIDPLTGREPDMESVRFRMGLFWSTYSQVLFEKKEGVDLEKPFREYLARGGPSWQTLGDNPFLGFDAYWVRYKLPGPGERGLTVIGRDKLFTHQRGGRQSEALPTLTPLNVR